MPSIVDPDVNAAKVMDGQPDHPINLFAIADVTRKRQSTLHMSDPRAGGFGTAGISREQNHFRALIGKPFCDGLANTHRGAGDHYYFSHEIRVSTSHSLASLVFLRAPWRPFVNN